MPGENQCTFKNGMKKAAKSCVTNGTAAFVVALPTGQSVQAGAVACGASALVSAAEHAIDCTPIPDIFSSETPEKKTSNPGIPCSIL